MTYTYGRRLRVLGLLGLLLLGCLGIAPTAANANSVVFNVNATVGNIFGGGPVGTFTGLTVTGTLDLNTITPGAVNNLTITVQGDPNIFTGSLGCPPTCTFIFNNGFNEFGLLDIGDPVGYAGGALQSGSYIALINPLGGPGAEVQYDLSGTVSPANGGAVPEPRSYAALLGLGMSGMLFARWRRRRA
jgi:hypothetical protein